MNRSFLKGLFFIFERLLTFSLSVYIVLSVLHQLIHYRHLKSEERCSTMKKEKKPINLKWMVLAVALACTFFFVLVFIGFEVQKDLIPNSVPLMQGHEQAIGLQKHE